MFLTPSSLQQEPTTSFPATLGLPVDLELQKRAPRTWPVELKLGLSPWFDSGGGGEVREVGEGREAGQSRGRIPEPSRSRPIQTFMVLCAQWREQLGSLNWSGGGPRHFGTREARKEDPGDCGSAAPGPQWALLAVFDVAASICQDNDEAGTIYLVRSPQTPYPFLPPRGPRSLSLHPPWPDASPCLTKFSNKSKEFGFFEPGHRLKHGVGCFLDTWSGRARTRRDSILTCSSPPIALESKGPSKRWGEGWQRLQGGSGGGGSKMDSAMPLPGELGRRGSESKTLFGGSGFILDP